MKYLIFKNTMKIIRFNIYEKITKMYRVVHEEKIKQVPEVLMSESRYTFIPYILIEIKWEYNRWIGRMY